MYIKSLKLKNFRNYMDLDMELIPGINILTGDNAQGKTNILEAVFFCAYGRSHRTSRDKEMQKFETEFTNVTCRVEKKGNGKKIEIRFTPDGKKFIEINGRKITRIPDLLGNLNIVMFSPEDLKVVKETPGIRRRFLDMEICSLDKVYYHNLVSYNKIILERNNLLKTRRVDPLVLDVYDGEAAKFGSEVIKRRLEYIEELNKKASAIHREITSGKEEIKYVYRSSINLKGDLKVNLKKGFNEAKKSDMEKCYSGVGPHRDDFSILINGADARNFGSQGQQRTAILTLKFASLGIIKDATGEYPVLLLDDVLSELDISRQKFILSRIDEIQPIITITGYEYIEKRVIDGAMIYRITEGSAERVVN